MSRGNDFAYHQEECGAKSLPRLTQPRCLPVCVYKYTATEFPCGGARGVSTAAPDTNVNVGDGDVDNDDDDDDDDNGDHDYDAADDDDE